MKVRMSQFSKVFKTASTKQCYKNFSTRLVNRSSTKNLEKSKVTLSSGQCLRSICRLPPAEYYSTLVKDGVERNLFSVDHETMPVVDIMEGDSLDKLMEYSYISPRPMSIEEMIERGDQSHYTEEQSYRFLKKEVAVRLAHMIMELQHLPKQLHAEEACVKTMFKYSQSFKEVIEYEDVEASAEVLDNFRKTLLTFRKRHHYTGYELAEACRAMKERNAETEDSIDAIFNSIKIFLDRFYTSRISIHMITNQHLALYCNDRVQPNNVGIIRLECDIRSALVDAVDEATTDVESVYMAAPKVEIQIFKKAKRCNEPVLGDFVPQHLLFIFIEILKNSMRATVEKHFDDQDNLPPVTAIICQADDDFTIKISDCGGGMDRESAAKCFMYQYTTAPLYSDTPLLGCGLPMARLYARYFQGDIKMASYEGYGTDVYIYLKAVANVARERLPVYNSDSLNNALEWDQWENDWSSWVGACMMQEYNTQDTLQ